MNYLVIAIDLTKPHFSYAVEYETFEEAELSYRSNNVLLCGYVRTWFLKKDGRWINIDFVENFK